MRLVLAIVSTIVLFVLTVIQMRSEKSGPGFAFVFAGTIALLALLNGEIP